MTERPSYEILLVNASPADTTLLQRALNDGQPAARVTHCELLADALQRLEQSRFDVVLLDAHLPGSPGPGSPGPDSSGLVAFRTLQSRFPHVPVIVTTGQADDPLADSIMAEGAQDCLVPGEICGDRLRRAIRYASERHAKHSALHAELRGLSLMADVGLALTGSGSLGETLQRCMESLVVNLGAAFARVWVLEPQDQVLELKASAGIYTHLDGRHSRIRVGDFKIGRIAAECRPHLTNDVQHDDQITDRAWAAREGIVAFAGYPLIVRGEIIGVMAIFARQALTPAALQMMDSVASHMAVGIERHRAEEHRRREEANWRSLFHSNLLGVVVCAFDGQIVEANESFLKMIGYTWEEIAADDIRWCDLTPSEFAHADAKCLAELQSHGRSIPFEKEYFRKNGTRVPILVGATLLQGRVDCAVAFVLDLTEVKQAELDTYTLRAVMDGTEDAIIGLDLNESIVAWNPAAERLYGYSAAEVLGEPVEAILPRAQQPEWAAVLARIRAGERVLPFETTTQRKGGQLLDVSVRVSPVRNRHGELIGMSQIVQDITEKKRLEEQFRQSQKMEAIGRLAGGVAHDFNNLLTVISGYSELLLQALPADSSMRDYVAEIHKAGERASALTGQLLSFSRKTVLEPKVVNLNEIVAQSRKMLQRIVGEDIDVRTQLDSQVQLVKVDTNQLEQALVNLVVNARDAMPRGGWLTIATRALSPDSSERTFPGVLKPVQHVLLTVTDTGCGMTADVQRHIFEPFFTTKGPGHGTGLGLPMVYGFVKQSEGHITVSSVPGQGTTIEIYLPQIAQSAPQPDVPQQRLNSNLKGTETILLVEDDDGIRAMTRMVLTAAGYHVMEASSGPEAIRLANSYAGEIHLLVSDVVMPQFGGPVVAQAVKISKPSAKVLFVSGYMDDAVLRHGVSRLETPFLQKPFSPAGLCQKVRDVLDASTIETGL